MTMKEITRPATAEHEIGQIDIVAVTALVVVGVKTPVISSTFPSIGDRTLIAPSKEH